MWDKFKRVKKLDLEKNVIQTITFKNDWIFLQNLHEGNFQQHTSLLKFLKGKVCSFYVVIILFSKVTKII